MMIDDLPGNAALEQYVQDVAKQLNASNFKFNGWDGYELDETSARIEKDNESASMSIEIDDIDD